MKITVAGETKEFNEGLTIAELIKQENFENPDYITVSVNDEFADNENFSSIELHDGDVVEFLYFMGGGSYDIL